MDVRTFRNNTTDYVEGLIRSEKSDSTVKKYKLALNNFMGFIDEHDYDEIDKDCLLAYKEYLYEKYKPKTVNLYIVGLNGYLKYMETPDLRVKSLNIQTNNSLDNCITSEEYKQILEAAKRSKNKAAYYVIRTLACTGMRVKGLRSVTVKVLKTGSFTATNKGKTRSIVLPDKICKELLEYCAEMDITSGFVFRGKDANTPTHEATVWRWCKDAARAANLDESKIYPHNFRHLFARIYMETYHDLPELADILGHTKIETTRIYTRTSKEEKRKKMDFLDL